jgi:N-acetylglucosamine kinase-like BadF-type ATPase
MGDSGRPPVQPLVLGLDGGNTKTVAIVAGVDGTVLGSGRSGCGDIYATTVNAALAEVEAAIDGALREAGGSRDDVVAAGCSLAGADWPEDFDLLEAEMRRRLPRLSQIVIVNDAIGALRAGTPDGQGAAVVCGTGSAIGARSRGQTWHASFWGEDGGAVTIGRAALRVMMRADLEIDPPVAFTGRALERLEVPTVAALVHRATMRGSSRTLLGALAPIVLDAADAGDPAACEIMTKIGRVLGEYAAVAVRRVGLDTAAFPLVLAGGVFLHRSPILRDEIARAVPGGRLIETEFEPVVGALLLAFDRLEGGVELDRLRESLPHADLFRTLAVPNARD